VKVFRNRAGGVQREQAAIERAVAGEAHQLQMKSRRLPLAYQ